MAYVEAMFINEKMKVCYSIKMKILVTGATGFIGRKLCEELLRAGHKVVGVTRNAKRAKQTLMLPINFIEGDLSKSAIKIDDNIDGVVNLLGENIGEKKWTPEQKEIIKNSRKVATENLNKSLKNQNGISFIQASAIGIYKDSKGDEILDENSDFSDNFLGDVCQKWESESEVFKKRFENYCVLRIGVVLGFDGALMHKLLPLYRLGLGGKLGSGKQWMSWIHRDDLVRMIIHSIDEKINGVYNAVAPDCVQNFKFNKSLSHFVQRPAFFTVPAFVLKLIMGDQSYLALSSQRIRSNIKSTGFKFLYPNIDNAFKEICSYKKTPPHNQTGFHHRLRQVQYIDEPIEKVFDFFSEAKNLEKITPEYLKFRITYQSTPKIKEGTIFKYKLRVHGLPVKWKTNIINWNTNEQFTDYQVKGPYKVWYHTHTFYQIGDGVLMVDDVLYKLPFAYFGELFGLWLVKKDVPDIFNYRAQVMSDFLR